MGDEGVRPTLVLLLVHATTNVVGKVTCKGTRRGQADAQGSGREIAERTGTSRDGTKAARGGAGCGRIGGENGEKDSQKRRRGPRKTGAFSPRHALGK